MDFFGEFITDLQKSTLKESQAAVLSSLKSQFGGESRFFSLEPADKTEQVSALCFIACLFGLVEVGRRGRHIGKRQYCLLCLG